MRVFLLCGLFLILACSSNQVVLSSGKAVGNRRVQVVSVSKEKAERPADCVIEILHLYPQEQLEQLATINVKFPPAKLAKRMSDLREVVCALGGDVVVVPQATGTRFDLLSFSGSSDVHIGLVPVFSRGGRVPASVNP